jgi:outer membrane protein assembly factor BamB
VTARFTYFRYLVGICAIIAPTMGSSYTAEVLAQEELLGPSPIVPVDIAWLLDLEQATTAPATIDDERIYLPLVDGTLLALNLDNGAQVWSRHRPAQGALLADNGMLIVTYEQILIAFDSASGRLLWTHRFDQRRVTTDISNGWLIVQLRDSTLVAFRASDGQEIWRRRIGHTMNASPAISGDRIYLPLGGESSGAIRALDLSTGNYVWEQTLTGDPGPILALDAIFVGATDNFFYRLSLDDGRIDWYVRTGGDIYGLAAIDEKRVYVTSLDNMVRALDRENGAQRWRMPLQGRPESGPIRVENSLVLSGLSPNIQIFHTETGRPMGRFRADNELAMPPHHVQRENQSDNRTVLLTRAGELMVLAPALGPEVLSAEFPLHPALPAPSVISQNELPFLAQPLLPAGPPISHARRFTVQVAIYDRSSAAEESVNILRDKGYPAFLTTGPRSRLGTLRRIRIGQSLGHGHAMRLIEQLHVDGVTDARLVTTTN